MNTIEVSTYQLDVKIELFSPYLSIRKDFTTLFSTTVSSISMSSVIHLAKYDNSEQQVKNLFFISSINFSNEISNISWGILEEGWFGFFPYDIGTKIITVARFGIPYLSSKQILGCLTNTYCCENFILFNSFSIVRFNMFCTADRSEHKRKLFVFIFPYCWLHIKHVNVYSEVFLVLLRKVETF